MDKNWYIQPAYDVIKLRYNVYITFTTDGTTTLKLKYASHYVL